MRAVIGVACGLAFLVGGCKRTTDAVAQLAENTRTATEQLAIASEHSNDEREREIDPNFADMHSAPPVKLVERYETRQGPDGLFVYDTETHSIARMGGQEQSGLTLKQADDAVDAMTAQDAKGVEH